MRNQIDREFGFWGNPIVVANLCLIWIALLLFFRATPELDLAIASFFYDPSFCENAKGQFCIGFPISNNALLKPIREILNYSPRVLGVGLLLYIIFQLVTAKRWYRADLRNHSIVFATLILGPLLVVNSGFKEFFGRARPRMIDTFGGKMDFTLPGDVIGQCTGNCSFVSGEASVGGWFLCCGLLFAPAIRPYAYTILFILGAFMALLRVAFGAHFMSDVLLGYLSTVIICMILVSAMQYFEKKAASEF